MNWKHIALLSVALFAMTQAIGVVSGFSIGVDWTIYGNTVEEAVANEALVRRSIIAVVAFPMYLVFFRRNTAKRLGSFVAVLIVTGLFTLSFEVLVGSPFPQAVLWSFSPTQLGTGSLALGISMLLFRSNKTMQPTCEDARG